MRYFLFSPTCGSSLFYSLQSDLLLVTLVLVIHIQELLSSDLSPHSSLPGLFMAPNGILGLDLREVRQMKERTNGLGAKGVEGFATRIESQPGFGGYTSKGSRGSTYQHLYGFGEGLLGFSGGQGNQIFNPLQINLQAGQGDNSQSQEQGINQPGSSPYGGGLHGQINRRFDQMESSHVIESSSTLIATNKMIVLYFTVISVVYRFLRMQS